MMFLIPKDNKAKMININSVKEIVMKANPNGEYTIRITMIDNEFVDNLYNSSTSVIYAYKEFRKALENNATVFDFSIKE